MTLKEAYEKADEEDSLSRERWVNHQIRKQALEGSKICFESSIADDWYIVPAEPKVLTEDELLVHVWQSQKHNESALDVNSYHRMIVRASHANGRLERDLEMKPMNESFVEARKFIGNLLLDQYNKELYQKMCGVVKAIPPLNKKD